MANEVTTAAANGGVKAFLDSPAVKKRIEETLADKATQFRASLLALVGQDELLAQATPNTVFTAALTAATLDLPINKNLGFAHIIGYKNNQKGIVEAQFQMGWKGFVQLAQRTGQYKTIAATPVYEGQLISQDPLRGNVYDWTKRESENVIGYVSIIVMVTGFEHELYMSRKDMGKHALQYSKSYAADQKYNSKKSPWTTNFDAMAEKTVIKLNLAKFGILSVEMQDALVKDQAVIREDGVDYVDGTDMIADEVKATDEKKAEIIAAAKEELGGTEEPLTDEDKAAILKAEAEAAKKK